MTAYRLTKLGFDLAYLSLLTKAGLKPLSRWEKKCGSDTEDVLRSLGLKTRRVERSVRSGKRITELVFSPSEECIGLYVSRFDGTPINRTRTNVRIEGLLFGYPSCCVESFSTRGYVKNSLRRADQRILFHWACPDCPVTPLLLPYYRKVYDECRRIVRGRMASMLWAVRDAVVADHLRRAVVTAASLVALGALPSGDAKYREDDPHWTALEAWEDPDADFLTSDEELLLHMDPANQDEDENLVPDGVDLARDLSAAIDSLPRPVEPENPPKDHPYVIDNMAFGLEDCVICGATVNMGFMEVVNPLENLSISIPYVAKHYMEHGGFSYAGTYQGGGGGHSGRLNVPLLRTVLGSEGLAHFIPEPEGTDADSDGLRDWEEPVFQTDPQNPDSDGDILPDGIDLARELRAQLDLLPRGETKDTPYIIDHPMDGIEICPRCGEAVVMDTWDVINPLTGASISIPSMALHFMQHGGFPWEGGYLFGGEGRVDPRQVRAVLTGEGDGHLLHVSPDADGDLLTDDEEGELRSDANNPDEDHNQVLDGIDLAKAAAADISLLPTKPDGNNVYRLDFQVKGLERCDICGSYDINMGHLTVCNPAAQLYAKVPYIALHYMEHGSFSFAGDVHGEGRLDVKLLVDALHSAGPGHMLAVPNDSDGDGISDREEEYFGTDKSVADVNIDGVPDGFALAREMGEAVGALPRLREGEEGPQDRPFVVEHMFRGLERCDVCGANVNMGFIEVFSEKECIRLEIPYIALHYMDHGSFSYKGDLHNGRVNPCLLDLALWGDGLSHLVVVAADSDGDGLLDGEEERFGCLPKVPDSDGDGVPDGVALARRMYEQIETLPVGENAAKTYVMHYEADCYAPCPICQELINCGNVGLTNPYTGLTMNIPYMNLHFMEMGSFASSPEERVDPVLLDAILRPGVVIVAGGTQATLRWKGVAGKSYQAYTALSLSGPWTAGPVLQGDGTEIVFTDDDAAGNGRKFYKILAW